ncbi:MAG: hypothetical protein ACXWP5_09845, partial [Bdellovibrionota bacterium]
MLRFRLFGRSLKLFFALAVPAAFVAWCVLGWQAASVTALGIFIFLILCATFAERPIIGAHGPCLPAASGIERSLEHATQGDGIRLPRVLIYENPLPNALVVRGMFGRGTVLLSQGLISLLREEELRQTLAGCLEELDQPGMVFRSTCSALAAICLRLAPAKWVGFMAGALQSDSAEVLSPQSGLGFLLVFPLLRFFLDLGR